MEIRVMPNVVYLHAEPTPIAQFLRVGTSGDRQLEKFLAGGQLPSRRLVVGLLTSWLDKWPGPKLAMLN